jgi:hypothetical protein
MPKLSDMGLNRKSPGSYRLEDDSPMPFGRYKSQPMSEVPASYFWYLWENGMREDQNSPVADYIRRNVKALADEYPDGIW